MIDCTYTYSAKAYPVQGEGKLAEFVQHLHVRAAGSRCGCSAGEPSLGQRLQAQVRHRGGGPATRLAPPWPTHLRHRAQGSITALLCPASCQSLQVAQRQPLLLDQQLQLCIITAVIHTRKAAGAGALKQAIQLCRIADDPAIDPILDRGREQRVMGLSNVNVKCEKRSLNCVFVNAILQHGGLTTDLRHESSLGINF